MGNCDTHDKLDGETMHEVENKPAQLPPAIKEHEIDNIESMSTLRAENQRVPDDTGLQEEMSNYASTPDPSVEPPDNLSMAPVSLSHTQPPSTKPHHSSSIPTGKSYIISCDYIVTTMLDST